MATETCDGCDGCVGMVTSSGEVWEQKEDSLTGIPLKSCRSGDWGGNEQQFRNKKENEMPNTL